MSTQLVEAPIQRRRVPAEPEFWILVLGDLAVFTTFFVVWAAAERSAPGMFEAGRASLNQAIGITNTFLLLSSSAAVAQAVTQVRRNEPASARIWYLVAIGGGGGFLALKAVEYGQHLSHGADALRSTFYVDYFVFTGVHALHVLIGLIALAIARSAARPTGRAPRIVLHEAVASYWHVIDIVWIMLFSLIYLI